MPGSGRLSFCSCSWVGGHQWCHVYVWAVGAFSNQACSNQQPPLWGWLSLRSVESMMKEWDESVGVRLLGWVGSELLSHRGCKFTMESDPAHTLQEVPFSCPSGVCACLCVHMVCSGSSRAFSMLGLQEHATTCSPFRPSDQHRVSVY